MWDKNEEGVMHAFARARVIESNGIKIRTATATMSFMLWFSCERCSSHSPCMRQRAHYILHGSHYLSTRSMRRRVWLLPPDSHQSSDVHFSSRFRHLISSYVYNENSQEKNRCKMLSSGFGVYFTTAVRQQ